MDHGTDRAARWIVAGTWFCAVIVMVTSASDAVLTFGAIGGNRLIGLGIGVAVDAALCVGLIGDRQLSHRSLTSPWGRRLRITTMVMSLVLNVGAPAYQGHAVLAMLQAIPSILLVILTEYGQDVHLLFAGLDRAARTGPITEPGPVQPVVPVPVQPTWTPTADRTPVPTPQTIPQRTTAIGPDPASRSTAQSSPATSPAETAPTVSMNSAGPDVPGLDRTGPTDEELLVRLVQLVDQSGVPSRNTVQRELGVGAGRASRLLGQLNSTPAGPPVLNGAAQRR